MRFGVIHSIADSRVTLFHYLPLVVTCDLEHPGRFGRSKVVSVHHAAVQRGEGVALVYGPTADAVVRLVSAVQTPDPHVVVVVAQKYDDGHPIVTKLRELQQRGQSVSVCIAQEGAVWLCDRSTGGFSAKDKSHYPKDAGFVAPVVKAAPKPAAPAPAKKKAAAEPAPTAETAPSVQ